MLSVPCDISFILYHARNILLSGAFISTYLWSAGLAMHPFNCWGKAEINLFHVSYHTQAHPFECWGKAYRPFNCWGKAEIDLFIVPCYLFAYCTMLSICLLYRAMTFAFSTVLYHLLIALYLWSAGSAMQPFTCWGKAKISFLSYFPCLYWG